MRLPSDSRSALRSFSPPVLFARRFFIPLSALLVAPWIALGATPRPVEVELPPSTQQSTEAPTTAISREVKDVFDRSAKAVVKIRGTDEHGEFAGTGFFIDPIGTLYTAYSVGGDADSLEIELDGKKYPLHVILTDVRSGIAILKAEVATAAL